jgi:hypothetical protein
LRFLKITNQKPEVPACRGSQIPVGLWPVNNLYTDAAVIIYLEDRRLRAAALLSEAQHICGGLPLLTIALEKIQALDRAWPLAVVELVIAAVLLVIFVRDLRRLLLHKASGHLSTSPIALGWFDLAAGVLLIFEAFHGHSMKPGYLRPAFFAGVATLAVGLLHSRLLALRSRRRYLRLDADGLECRPGPFQRFAFGWTKLESVTLSEDEVVFREKKGQQRIIRLRRYDNRDEIREAIADRARAAGLLEPDRRPEATGHRS